MSIPTEQTIEQMSQEEALYLLCLHSFSDFYQLIFSQAIDGFTWGWHLEDFSERLQWQDRTCTLGSRSIAKSYTLYAYLAWRRFRLPLESCEAYYVSSNETLARHHVRKARQFIEYLEMQGIFQDQIQLTPSRGVLGYQHRPTGNQFSCEPLALTGNVKGRHCDLLICDDLMGRENEVEGNMVSLADIEKVKTIFFNDLYQLPRWKQGAQLHVTGNAVDPGDIIFTLKERSKERIGEDGFHWQDYPAIYEGESIWPEMFSLDDLDSIRTNIGDRPFQRQFLCVPERKTTAFLTDDELDGAIMEDEELEELDAVDGRRYAGIDLGKVRHPSHIAIFARSGNRLIQIYSEYLDGVDHVDQIERCRQLIKQYKIRKFFYDGARGEWTLAEEKGDLPRQMESIALNAVQNKWAVATALRSCFRGGDSDLQIRLLPDKRQTRQLLSVDESLQSPDTRGSHGDAFWSVSLACAAAIRYGKRGAGSASVGGRKKESGGLGSLFDNLDVDKLLGGDLWGSLR